MTSETLKRYISATAKVVSFKIRVFLKKRLHEYILLSTLEQKMAFLAIYRPKRARNRPFFHRFWLFPTAVKVYMTSGAARMVSSSF